MNSNFQGQSVFSAASASSSAPSAVKAVINAEHAENDAEIADLRRRFFMLGDRLCCTFVAADRDLFSGDGYFYASVRDFQIADGAF